MALSRLTQHGGASGLVQHDPWARPDLAPLPRQHGCQCQDSHNCQQRHDGQRHKPCRVWAKAAWARVADALHAYMLIQARDIPVWAL